MSNTSASDEAYVSWSLLLVCFSVRVEESQKMESIPMSRYCVTYILHHMVIQAVQHRG